MPCRPLPPLKKLLPLHQAQFGSSLPPRHLLPSSFTVFILQAYTPIKSYNHPTPSPGYLPLSFFHSNCADIILMDRFLQLWSVIFRLLVVPAPFIALSLQPLSPHRTVHCASHHLVIIVSLIIDIALLIVNIMHLIIDITHLLINTVSFSVPSALPSPCLGVAHGLIISTPLASSESVYPSPPRHLCATHCLRAPRLLCPSLSLCFHHTKFAIGCLPRKVI